MKYFPLPTTEFRSLRFEALCDRLGAEDRKDRGFVKGCLMEWATRWAEDSSTDCGIFWDIPLPRHGVWAEWDKPLEFGRALSHSGYLDPVERIYPSELCRGRSGHVYTGFDGKRMIDLIWPTVLVKRDEQAAELVLFLSDPGRRAQQAAKYNISHPVPDGWLDGFRTEVKPNSGVVPDPTHDLGIPQSVPAAVTAVLSPHTPHVSGNVNELKNQRNVTGRTGKKPTREQFECIREYKYASPILALQSLDDTPGAMYVWKLAVKLDKGSVQTLLAELTESDERYFDSTIWPPAIVFSACKKIIRDAKQRTRTTGDVGGVGGKDCRDSNGGQTAESSEESVNE